MKTEIQELKIRLDIPAVTIRNGIIVDTHQQFSSTTKDSPYQIGTIANNVAAILPSSTIRGWLRFGMTEYLIHDIGISVCHGYDLHNVSKTGKRYKNTLEDLIAGYHLKRIKENNQYGKGNKGKPECLAAQGESCIIGKMFGSFTGNHSVFSTMPFKIDPVKAKFNQQKANVTAMGNYRQLNVSPRSADGETPYQTFLTDVIANVDGIQYIRMYGNDTTYIGMFIRGIEYLYEHRNEFQHQLGGSRTAGHGFVNPSFINPLYSRKDAITYVTQLHRSETEYESKESIETDEGKTANMKRKDDEWSDLRESILNDLDVELEHQKELFGIEKEWWTTEI